MKILNILILIILFTNAFCFLRKKHESLGKKKHSSKAKQLEEYSLKLITSINQYRAEHSYPPEITYDTQLEQTAKQEAQSLIAEQNFGTHTNFQTLRYQLQNEFLTEIVLKIAYSDELPPADVFCQHVVKAIGESQERYLSFQYTEGGAAIMQDVTSGLYYIVIHLAKLGANGNNGTTQGDEIPTYGSCKEALAAGYTGETIMYEFNNEKIPLTCEHTIDNGGWSLILDEHEDLTQDNILPVNTLGLQYEQILFKVDEGYEYNSRNNDPVQYKFDGFLFQANALKFGETWYVSEEFDINFSYDRDHLKEKAFYKQADQITVLEPSETCYFEDSNQPNYCAKSFIFNAPLPQGELNAISDVESLGKYAYQNNKWNAYFKLYVR